MEVSPLQMLPGVKITLSLVVNPEQVDEISQQMKDLADKTTFLEGKLIQGDTTYNLKP